MLRISRGLLVVAASLGMAASLHAADANAIVLEQIRAMPVGGGYSTTSAAHEALHAAASLEGGAVHLRTESATPSFCSGATYLLFLKTLGAMQRGGSVSLPENVWSRLLPAFQPDGTGVWGRWNANGPGTPRLFYELNLGPNFTDFSEARPGDFMKIFWNSKIGCDEHGHSVVFLGTEMKDGVEQVRFWSSNKPLGYGEKTVPRSKIVWAIFSRLEHPENLKNLPEIPASDAFLAGLLRHDASLAETERLCGLVRE